MDAGPAPTRVLIADDDSASRELMVEMLRDRDEIEVVGTANDAEHAVKMTATLRPDLVILDWVMPGGGGGNAARMIAGEHPEVKMIALTGMDSRQASYDMLSAGALGFLQKGCTTEELLETIATVMRF